MVLSTWKTCTAMVAITTALLTGRSAATPKAFDVSSFDISQLTSGDSPLIGALVDELENTGIVSLREIPHFSQLRTAYLTAATQCAALEAAKESPGLLYKTLVDGTERWTISTKTQFGNPDLAQTKLDSVCPEYLPILREFSELVNQVAVQFAHVLDDAASPLATAMGDAETTGSLEHVLTSAENLDHFHSYASPTSAVSESADNVSLEFHTDHGVMIFMTAPAFYALGHDATAPIPVAREAIVSGPDASAGLLIKLPGRADVVQPVLKDDELVVMIGEGFRSWVGSSHSFRPVLHAMQMPTFSPSLGQVSRSWFGKMVLLPQESVMPNTGLTFAAYSDQVTAYVRDASDVGAFSAVACPPLMTLAQSDNSCAIKVYEPKEGGSATVAECQNWCNNAHMATKCNANCDYVGTLPDGGVDCWMVCLPIDTCGEGQVAQCNPSGAQNTVCVNATSATAF